MRLYMVRHGQSETNLEGRFTGWAEASLTEQGIADAQRAGAYLQRYTFDRVYSSDLSRAIQTAQAALPGCSPVLVPELRELSVGRLERQKISDCEKQYGPRFWIAENSYDFTPFGGENERMLRSRVDRFFQQIAKEETGTIAAFAHAGPIQCALNVVMGQSLDRTRIRVANGSVAVFAYENGRWILEAWGAGT